VTPHQIIAVAARLFAIWLVIYFLPGVLGFYAQWVKYSATSKLLPGIVVTVVTAGIVIILWRFPQTIARSLIGASRAEPAGPISADTWLAMGCAVIGVWLLASCLPSLVRDLLILQSAGTGDETSQVKQYLFYDGVRIVIALWLLFGAGGLRKVFWWAQNAGVHYRE